jgi:Xaa-Pro dipeptidase
VRTDLLDRARAFLQQEGLDAWVVCDFRGSNPVLAPLLGGRLHLTRRVALVLPADGAPRLLVHAIEAGQFADSPFATGAVGGEEGLLAYRGHADFLAALGPLLAGCRRVAIEYSPGGSLPAVSWIDAGTLELLQGLTSATFISSADLLQATLAVWDEPALQAHLESAAAVAAARDAAFETIRRTIADGGQLTEFDVQRQIGDDLTAAGFETDHPAIVGVNEHSGDPHYAPRAGSSSAMRAGDWVLIDLWARRPGDTNVFADITWVATAAPAPTAEQQRVFDIVRGARDLIVHRLHEAWRAGDPLQGCQLDRLARDHITEAGFGDRFLHRTGHSLSPGPAVHGLGANLDDVESRDTRTLLPGTGFTIEPGIYLPGFGVRLEIDVFVDPADGPTVTTPAQEEIVRLA